MTAPSRGFRATQGFYGFCQGKNFSDDRGIPFYYVKIGVLKYLPISGDMWYPSQNGPIGYRKKLTNQKKPHIVQVGAVIHKYQGEGAI